MNSPQFKQRKVNELIEAALRDIPDSVWPSDTVDTNDIHEEEHRRIVYSNRFGKRFNIIIRPSHIAAPPQVTLGERVSAIESALAKLEGSLQQLPDMIAKRLAEDLRRADTAPNQEQASSRIDPPRREFRALADWWHEATDGSSSPQDKTEHPAYLRIIELGTPIVPFILEDLGRRGGHWFAALEKITGIQPPLAPGATPSLRAEREAWLAWGKEQGLLD